MTDIVVRYEPTAVYKWTLGQIHFHTFAQARKFAKYLNGGRLPRINTPEYADMFPDRVCVFWDIGERFTVQIGMLDPLDYGLEHTAAMTAAHELATNTKESTR